MPPAPAADNIVMRSAYRQAATVVGVLALGAVAIVAITHLQARADESKQAQLTLASIKTELNRLQSAPFQASPRTGGSPMTARALIDIGEGRIASALDRLERSSPPDELSSIHSLLEKNYAALEGIYAIGASGADYGRKADRLAAVAAEWAAKTDDVLAAASHDYDRRASHLQLQATLGPRASSCSCWRHSRFCIAGPWSHAPPQFGSQRRTSGWPTPAGTRRSPTC